MNRNLINEHGLDSAHEYYELIITHVENNRRAQARHMYHAMSKAERAEFFDWADTAHYYDAEEGDTGMHQLHLYLEEPMLDEHLDEDGEGWWHI